MLTYRSTRAALLTVVLAAGAGQAQGQGSVPMKVTVTFAGRTETLRGTGQCGHEPRASLYGASAALWLVRYAGTGEGPRLSLSYWRVAAASGDEQQLSLSVRARNFDHQPAVGEAQHTISTIKDGEPEGSGRATFRPTATGGRFQIAGKAQEGAALQVTIECARFGGIHAEGG